ncbi:uncharacterized protein LOC127880975 [Dreissena polymorpha]|nr:uncharacterized protein LOC127880975 [Dreissena polymorpha]XP_052284453.1 uncharacterized protein LOC127880975 [Dreissena polymorpha]XP_052284454.1 uncharacterized protein LOC127880975 [Dreissena polymorpha]KAH3817144.1 hypothetical protein DPMN_118672 [Dreissena polymorpha]
MNGKKENGKKEKKLKHINHISQPLNIRHNFHLGADGFSGSFNEEEIRNLFSNASKTGPITSPRDTAPVEEGVIKPQPEKFPPTPCRSRDISRANSVASDTDLVVRLKEVLIPALRFEIDELLDKKLARIIPELTAYMTADIHCRTCQCHDKVLNQKRKSELAIMKDNSAITNGITQDNRNSPYDERGSKQDRGRHGLQKQSNSKVDYLNEIQTKDAADFLRKQTLESLETLDVSTSNTPMDRGHLLGTDRLDFRNNGDNWSYKDVSSPSNDIPKASTGIKNNYSNGEHREEMSYGDERDCLANAIESNAKHVLRLLEGDINEFTEQLLSNGCLTEQDNNALQAVKTLQEQSSHLLTIIAGRDLHVLRSFLGLVKQRNAELYTHISQRFDQNSRQGYVNGKCVVCRLKRYVDVRYILETLRSSGIVDDDFRDLAVRADVRIGGQNSIWGLTIQRSNEAFQTSPNVVNNALQFALAQHSHYEYLSVLVEKAFSTDGCLICTCSPLRPGFGETNPSTFSFEDSSKSKSSNTQKHYTKKDAEKSQGGHRQNIMSPTHPQSRNTINEGPRPRVLNENPEVLVDAYNKSHGYFDSPRSPNYKETVADNRTNDRDTYSRSKTQNERLRSPTNTVFKEIGADINSIENENNIARNKTHIARFSSPVHPVIQEDRKTPDKGVFRAHQDRIPDLSSYLIGNGKTESTQVIDAQKSHDKSLQRSSSLEVLNEDFSYLEKEVTSLKTKKSQFHDPKRDLKESPFNDPKMDPRIPVPALRKSLMVTKEGKDLKASFV